MKVYIIGTGYVGLVTAVCLADLGHEVCGVDIDPAKIELLKKGFSPIFEPGLEELLKKNLQESRLSFRVGIDGRINEFDLAIIAVGTPERERDGRADMFYVAETAKEIAKNVKGRREFIVVGKSTVPIGTAVQIRDSLSQYGDPATRFIVGSNPETLQEGSAVENFCNPDRIIIGGEKIAQDALLKLYEKINCRKVVTNTVSAETSKLVSNFMLAQRVSTTSMVSRLCDETGADVEEVMLAVGLDPRIGSNFLRAGIGFGGSCFPKDTKSLAAIARHHRLDPTMFEAVTSVNESQVKWFCRKVERMLSLFTIRKRKVGVLGLSFKPNTDDIREAPSLKIIKWLVGEGAKVKVFDPVARVDSVFGNSIQHCEDMYAVAEGAEVLLLLTEWDCIKKIDLEKVRGLMETPKIVDGRNIFDPFYVRSLGFKYDCMGRP